MMRGWPIRRILRGLLRQPIVQGLEKAQIADAVTPSERAAKARIQRLVTDLLHHRPLRDVTRRHDVLDPSNGCGRKIAS